MGTLKSYSVVSLTFSYPIIFMWQSRFFTFIKIHIIIGLISPNGYIRGNLLVKYTVGLINLDATLVLMAFVYKIKK